MLAFHGKEEIKKKYLDRVRAHRKADQLIKGTYWNDGKGCAVGCTIHSSNHRAYETELGIPEFIARLEDGLFERLPNGKAMEWPEKFLSAIPVGVDLSKVGPRFMIWLLSDKEEGILCGVKNEKVIAGVRQIVKLYEKKLAAIEITQDDWNAARSALAARAALDARSALAALTPEQRRAYDEVKEKMYVRMSEKLIELLEAEQPIMVGSK